MKRETSVVTYIDSLFDDFCGDTSSHAVIWDVIKNDRICPDYNISPDSNRP